MRAFALCTQAAGVAVEKAIRGEIYTSPPIDKSTFAKLFVKMEAADFLYFRLHIIPHSPGIWWGDNGNRKQPYWPPAVTKDQLALVNLTGKVVVIANCYGLKDEMVLAMLAQGARAVVAGEGPNYAAKRRVIGADLLAKWMFRGLRMGLSPGGALKLAKARLIFTAFRETDRDARAFQLVGGKV
jgi:hypothetical protein